MQESTPFRFNEKKAVQAMAVLLKLAGPDHRHNYLRALKLLYLADRRSIERFGRPITGDKFFALDHGPVLSLIYDRIMGRSFAVEWDNYIRTTGFDIQLVGEPGTGELAPAEVEILQSVWTEHLGLDQWQVVDETHRLPEWLENKPPAGSSQPIPLRSVLRAIGKEDAFDKVVSMAHEEIAFEQIFG